MAKKEVLPEVVYIVRVEADTADSYLATSENLDEAVYSADEERVLVGTYKLVRTGRYEQTVREVEK